MSVHPAHFRSPDLSKNGHFRCQTSEDLQILQKLQRLKRNQVSSLKSLRLSCTFILHSFCIAGFKSNFLPVRFGRRQICPFSTILFTTFMVWCGGLRIGFVILVLLASSCRDLQLFYSNKLTISRMLGVTGTEPFGQNFSNFASVRLEYWIFGETTGCEPNIKSVKLPK